MTLIDWFWADHWLGRAHVILAAVALIAGPAIFLTRKGTPTHRLVGFVYLLAMLVVNASALSTYEMSGKPNLFHAFALMSLGAIVPGFIAIARRNISSHYYFMSWSYFGLMAAFLSQIATQTGLFPRLGAAFGGVSIFVVVLVASTLASFAVSFLINRQATRLLPRYAPGEG
ncbi:MAG: DUF2306 domain-containing protein [Pseudomonadota bacterium]